MGKMNFTGIRHAFAFGLITMVPIAGYAQTVVTDVLQNGTLKQQMDFIQEKTRIYEDFRAIREDMFQKMKVNSLDSLKAAKSEIKGLKNDTRRLNSTIDSLNTSVGTIRADLDQMTKTKNSISLMGIEINKNVIMGFCGQ